MRVIRYTPMIAPLMAASDVVMGKAAYGVPPFGETGCFDRRLADGRFVLKWRDEEIIVAVAGALKNAELKSGDLVRFTREMWMAYEKMDNNTSFWM